MNKKTETILLIAVFALFIGIAVFAYNTLSPKVSSQNNIDVSQNEGEGSPTNQAEENEKIKAPDFTALDMDGNSVKMSDLFGKPIVLNFWASWCSSCKSEMPEFNEAYEKAGEDITFMMVDLVDGKRETKEKGAQYIKEQGFSFPVYFDTKQNAANIYGIVSIPTTIFIDKNGYIATGVRGAIDVEALQKGIDLIK
jgi:thiol-disulfide isomerase/thioredoxin